MNKLIVRSIVPIFLLALLTQNSALAAELGGFERLRSMITHVKSLRAERDQILDKKLAPNSIMDKFQYLDKLADFSALHNFVVNNKEDFELSSEELSQIENELNAMSRFLTSLQRELRDWLTSDIKPKLVEISRLLSEINSDRTFVKENLAKHLSNPEKLQKLLPSENSVANSSNSRNHRSDDRRGHRRVTRVHAKNTDASIFTDDVK